jgi:predicted enzyme related to lactoylglutathione lyase
MQLAGVAAPWWRAGVKSRFVTKPRICYLEIPAADPRASARFYSAVFDWSIRERGDGVPAFDDGGLVSGAFVSGRTPQGESGITTYVMVDDAASTIERIVAAGGTILAPLGHSPETIALFQDPAGNVLGIYQEPV